MTYPPTAQPTAESEPKFIQIAAGGDGLYALDKDGRVWWYWDKTSGSPALGTAGKPAAWHKLSEKRVVDE